MKTKHYNLLFLIILLFSFVQVSAQVTIGHGTAPEQGALLELKEKEVVNPDKNNISGLENSTKGILYPKVSLKASNLLTPLYGGADQGNGNWSDEATAEQKVLATGMVVYNVNPDAKNMEEGLYMWRLEEWIKLSGGIGAAQFNPVDCSAIKVNGNYVEQESVDSENSLTIELFVVKTGTYTISARSDNGYNFYISGVALDNGTLIIQVPCQGKPEAVGIDKLTVEGINLVDGCEPEVEVVSAVADYSLNCNSIVVNGNYLKGKVLDGSHTITVNVSVSKIGSYEISTPLTSGISFVAKGVFPTTGTHQIILLGSGKPTVNADFPVTVHSNTTDGNTTCSALIPITLPAMTFAVIGSGIYSWNEGARKNAITNGGVSFGMNGIVRIESFTQLWSTTNRSDATIGYRMAMGQTLKNLMSYCILLIVLNRLLT